MEVEKWSPLCFLKKKPEKIRKIVCHGRITAGKRPEIFCVPIPQKWCPAVAVVRPRLVGYRYTAMIFFTLGIGEKKIKKYPYTYILGVQNGRRPEEIKVPGLYTNQKSCFDL
jgi:hypothetical protein